MAKKVIVIDGYIGPFAYSKQFVKQMLEGSENDEVEVLTSSLGGSVDHALNIHDQFANHGNVTFNYTGFNASSSTLISLGAKNIRMSDNSFYLIHKVMSWVDEFGLMNEDDIDDLIKKLEKEKNENAKITLQLAKMYASKTGKPVKEILDLMKEQTWLTAEEAKTWGFVDEIYTPGKKENYLEDLSKVAMITASGFPSPVRKHESKESPVDEEGLFNRMFNRIKDAIKPNKKQMKKQFLNVNKALKVEKLESTEEGVFLNEEQLEAIENSISAGNQAVTERDQARTELTNATTALDTIDPSVASAQGIEAKVAAIQAHVAKKPGAKSATIEKETDGDDETDHSNESFWDRFNRLKKSK